MMKIKEQDIPQLVAAYNLGKTYEELALDYGCSTPTMRRAINGLVQPRPKGAQPGKSKLNNSVAAAESTGPSLPTRARRASYRGHRRRSRY